MSKRQKSGRGRTAPGSSHKGDANDPEMLSRALKYAAKGWPVVRMHTIHNEQCSCHEGIQCKRPGKHPDTPHGVKDATTEETTITQWWTEKPSANVGIAMGQASGLFALDVDPRNDGFETLKKLEAELGELPQTVTTSTGGGGEHRIFCVPNFKVKKDAAGKLLGPGIDILSDDSIAIAPPSKHKSGARYKWRAKRSPKKMQLANLPEVWLRRLQSSKQDQAKSDSTDATIREGERNKTLTQLAGSLHRSRLSAEALLAALRAENKAHCSPPLEDDEVDKIANSVARYARLSDDEDEAQKVLRLVLARHFKDGEHLLFAADGQFWHYSGTMWTAVQDKWIEGRILESIQTAPLKTKTATAPLVGQVHKLLAAKLASDIDRLGFLNDPPAVINCRNCEIWIGKDGRIEKRSHRPDSYLRYCLDVDFDPKAKCPKYDEALLGIFAKASNPIKMRRFWNELVGYIIQPQRNIPIIVVLLGSGNNGKTALVKTLLKLLGKMQVHAGHVEDLDKNRFATGSLLGKLIFLDDDVKAGARLPDGVLKTISEAKEITGEIKFKAPFTFTVRTVPLLLCNNVPSLADVSKGMRRRLMVIPFDRTFTEKDEDKDLFENIRSNEMPGVLNRALAGYVRLLKRKKFNPPQPVEQALTNWLEQANPLPAFIRERCVKGPKLTCSTQTLYDAYQNWAQAAGFTMFQNRITFRRNLEHLGFTTTHKNKGQTAVGIDLKSL